MLWQHHSCVCEKESEWVSECVWEWVCEYEREWVSECESEWVSVCVRVRQRESAWVCVRVSEYVSVSEWVCECEWVSECVWEWLSVCVRVRERDREKVCTCMQVIVCVLCSDLDGLSSHFPNMLTVFIVWTRLLATPVGLSHFPGLDNSLSPHWTKTTPHLYASHHVYTCTCSYVYVIYIIDVDVRWAAVNGFNFWG